MQLINYSYGQLKLDLDHGVYTYDLNNDGDYKYLSRLIIQLDFIANSKKWNVQTIDLPVVQGRRSRLVVIRDSECISSVLHSCHIGDPELKQGAPIMIDDELVLTEFIHEVKTIILRHQIEEENDIDNMPVVVVD